MDRYRYYRYIEPGYTPYLSTDYRYTETACIVETAGLDTDTSCFPVWIQINRYSLYGYRYIDSRYSLSSV